MDKENNVTTETTEYTLEAVLNSLKEKEDYLRKLNEHIQQVQQELIFLNGQAFALQRLAEQKEKENENG